MEAPSSILHRPADGLTRRFAPLRSLRWRASNPALAPLLAGAILVVTLTLLAPTGIWEAGPGWGQAEGLLAGLAAMVAILGGAMRTEDRSDRLVRWSFAAAAFFYSAGRLVDLAAAIGGIDPPWPLDAVPLAAILGAVAIGWFVILGGRFALTEQLAVVLDSAVVFCTVAAASLVVLGGQAGIGQDLTQLAYTVAFAGMLGASVLLSLALTPRRFAGGWLAIVAGFVPLVAGSAWALVAPATAAPYPILQVTGVLVCAYGAATWTADADPSPAFQRLAARVRSWLPMAAVAFAPILIVLNELLLSDRGNLGGGLSADALLALVLMLCVLRQTMLLRERDRQASEVRRAADQARDLMDDLGQSERRFRSLVTNSSDVFLIIGPDGVVAYQSPAVSRVLGYAPDDRLGRQIFELTHPDDLAFVQATIADLMTRPGAEDTIELRTRHADGSWRTLEATGRNMVDDPSVGGIVVNYRDVTERKQLEDQLTQQAFHDSLTGLANRALFSDRVEHALRRRSAASGVAVLFMDLDDFKTINDSLGHIAGDAVLREVADRLVTCLRDGDTVSRLGGDEFAVLIEDAGEMEALAVAERILSNLETPFDVGGRRVHMGASIGLALGSERSGPDDLLRNADVAMYTAKGRGKGRVETFEPAMHAAVVTRLELRGDLEHALEREQLRIRYQPVFDLASGRLDSFEALLRWRHSERGEVSPAEFIPLAEETGLIVPIGRWVLEQACLQAQAWRETGSEEVSVGVNLSSRQIREPEIVAWVAAALESSGLPADHLILELTETGIMQDDDGRLHDLSRLGVRLALDDFGTGYSSLSYLARFPIDILKIDRSFIAGLGDPAEDSALVPSVIQLAAAMNLRTVAEGIERMDQLERLKSLGCDYGQGFLFAPPMDAIRATTLVTDPTAIAEVASSLTGEDAVSGALAAAGCSRAAAALRGRRCAHRMGLTTEEGAFPGRAVSRR